MVTTSDIKKLREETGAGVMDAKRALEEASGDFAQAKELIRQQGIASAAKRADRATSEGVVESYIHGGGRIGALVELQCETDFVARTDAFKQLAKDVAMHIAAMNPLALVAEDVPADAPGDLADHALLKQSFIRDSSQTIEELIQAVVGQTGENIQIGRFSRFELGAG